MEDEVRMTIQKFGEIVHSEYNSRGRCPKEGKCIKIYLEANRYNSFREPELARIATEIHCIKFSGNSGSLNNPANGEQVSECTCPFYLMSIGRTENLEVTLKIRNVL